VSTVSFAPVPDFRYVGLEPIAVRKVGALATALGLGAGVTLALSGIDSRHAVFAGVSAALASAFALRGAGAVSSASGSARMAIVPWGVLVDPVGADAQPRILHWPAVRNIDVASPGAGRYLSAPAASTRVVVETERERFVGEAVGTVRLEGLVTHLDAYASEQSTAIALDLEGEGDDLDAFEPSCEVLIGSAKHFLDSASASRTLELPPAGYRNACAAAASPRAVDVLRRVLRDRTKKRADPRAFAAVLAAEVHAEELAPELVALTQCPHPLVAAVAKQAARKLGAPRSRTGSLDEVAPFLTWPSDRACLEAW
jgi:hypothetical protein